MTAIEATVDNWMASLKFFKVYSYTELILSLSDRSYSFLNPIEEINSVLLEFENRYSVKFI